MSDTQNAIIVVAAPHRGLKPRSGFGCPVQSIPDLCAFRATILARTLITVTRTFSAHISPGVIFVPVVFPDS